MEIELGDKVRDKITGYVGIVTAKTIFINGCVQFMVARVLKKGEKPDPMGEPSIDSATLEIIKKDAANLKKKEKPVEIPRPTTGGPTTFGIKMRGY